MAAFTKKTLHQKLISGIFPTKSKLKTHSQKHIHGHAFENTFELLILSPKNQAKGFESPIPLKAIIKCKNSNKKPTKDPLGLE